MSVMWSGPLEQFSSVQAYEVMVTIGSVAFVGMFEVVTWEGW